MKYKICKLNFRFRARFGSTGYGLENTEEFLTSERLFNAFFIEYINLFGVEEAYKLKEDKNFKITSGMPFIGEEIFFIKPKTRISNLDDTFYDEYRKKIKGLKYLSKQNFEKIINGNYLTTKDYETEFKNNKEISTKIFTDISQKVKIGYGENNTPFRVREIYFDKEAGFYFLYSISEKFEENFKKALNSLGFTGIGSDLSTGAGAFTPHYGEINIQTPENGIYMLLSSYYPNNEEIENLEINSISYSFRKKAGWILNTDYTKKRTYVMEEGSILKNNPEGTIVNISEIETLPSLLFGKAFTIPVKEITNE